MSIKIRVMSKPSAEFQVAEVEFEQEVNVQNIDVDKLNDFTRDLQTQADALAIEQLERLCKQVAVLKQKMQKEREQEFLKKQEEQKQEKKVTLPSL